MPPPKLVPSKTIFRFFNTLSQKESRWRRFCSGPRRGGGFEAAAAAEEEVAVAAVALAPALPSSAKSVSEVKPHPIKSGHQHSTPCSASKGSNLRNSRQEESNPWRQTTGGRSAEEEEEEGEGEELLSAEGPTKAVSRELETPSTGSCTRRILEMKARAAGSVTSLPNSRGMKAGMMESLLSVAVAEVAKVEEEEEVEQPCRRSIKRRLGRDWSCGLCGGAAAGFERGIFAHAWHDDTLVAAKRMVALKGEWKQGGQGKELARDGRKKRR